MEEPGRQSRRAEGQPRDREARRRDARQRARISPRAWASRSRGLDDISAIDPANFKKMIVTATQQFPNFCGSRRPRCATPDRDLHGWSAILWAGGEFHTRRCCASLQNLGSTTASAAASFRLRRAWPTAFLEGKGAAGGRQIRRRARRFRDDHAGRHLDGAHRRGRRPVMKDRRAGDPLIPRPRPR